MLQDKFMVTSSIEKKSKSFNTDRYRKIIPGESNWYAVYTRPHHEKKIYKLLQKEKIEAFLPLQTTIRQWSDRKKKVIEPLFRCYVFVKIYPKEQYRVLNTSGIVRFVSFEGKAVPIPGNQIHFIQNLLASGLEMSEANENFSKGTIIEIIAGPFIGIVGEMMNFAGKSRVIIHIKEIDKSIMVNVPINFLREVRN
jgi:transcriptional antiterminator RfaH